MAVKVMKLQEWYICWVWTLRYFPLSSCIKFTPVCCPGFQTRMGQEKIDWTLKHLMSSVFTIYYVLLECDERVRE